MTRNNSEDPLKLAGKQQFLLLLGMFHAVWSSAELVVDIYLGSLLGLTDEETHVLTAGMELNRKASLIRDLVKQRELPNASTVLKHLGVLQNESLRNVFAHAHIRSNSNEVIFVERSRGGPYRAKEHAFTLEKLLAHVEKIADAAAGFQTAVGVTDVRCDIFSDAAVPQPKQPAPKPAVGSAEI